MIRKDPLRFFFARRNHTRRYAPDPSKTEHRAILDTLVRDGICVIPDYMEPAAVEELRTEVGRLLRRVRDGEEIPGTRAFRYPEYACYHLDGAEAHAPKMTALLDDPMLLSVAAAYGGGRVVPRGVRAELRDEPLKNEMVDDLHADTWRFRFKAILYLTDVTEETSPFRFLPGTHRGDGWRVRRFGYDYLGHALHGYAPTERIRSAEAHRRLEASPERRVTGPAGTLILFDTRGLHSATTLQSGTRMILVRTFVPEEDLG
jgi:hypothetical protein